MRETKLADLDDSWTFLGGYLCFLNVSRGAWQIFFDTKTPPYRWVGAMRVFYKVFVIEERGHTLECREYDIFNKGVVFRQWGFEEHFGKNGCPYMAVKSGEKWFLVEDQDELELNPEISEDGRLVTYFRAELFNRHKKIEIEVKP